MDIVSPLPAVLAVILAVLVCAVLARRLAPPDAQGLFVAIDGLRGYLAFCVFLHHAVIWFFTLKKISGTFRRRISTRTSVSRAWRCFLCQR